MCDTVNFLSQKMLLEIGDREQLGIAPYCRKEIIMCICTDLWRDGCFCLCFLSFIIEWFPSVAKLNEKKKV